MAYMNIGIIGTGVVGQTLGTGLAAKGHAVKIGSRDPQSDKLQEWKTQAGPNASTGTLEEAAKFGDLVIVATNWDGTENALELAGPDNLAGKVVIDTTNPLSFGASGPDLGVGFTDSAGEQVQRYIPQARVVKALNIVSAFMMLDPDALGETADMFIAGNDAGAKQEVTAFLESFGWPVIDLGGIQEARLLEALGMVWVKYYFNVRNEGRHAFKLIRQ